jgi:hypothetical protein
MPVTRVPDPFVQSPQFVGTPVALALSANVGLLLIDPMPMLADRTALLAAAVALALAADA